MKHYPALEFASRHGRSIATAVGVAFAVAAAAGFIRTSSFTDLALGLLGAGVAFVLLRLAVEVVELVADTLLPK